MRRALGVVVLAVMLAPALAATASGHVEDFRDGFDAGNYSGNEGSQDFDGPWVEFGDPGAGSYEDGSVYVDDEGCPQGACLHIEGHGVVAESYGVRRSADLSDFETAELGYEIVISPAPLTTSALDVQVWNGDRWITVAEHSLSSSAHQQKKVSVTGHIGETFAVRFLVAGVDGGLLDLSYTGSTVIDDVRIVGTVVGDEPVTSTSSSSTSSVPTSSAAGRNTSSSTGSTPPSSPTSSRVTSTSLRSTTSEPATSGATSSEPDGSSGATTATAGETTTTHLATTTTTTGLIASAGSGTPPFDSGLRQPAVGLISDYRTGMMGDLGMDEVEVLGVDLDASFSMVVETFETMKVWIAVLALVITAAVIGGMDWRRSRAEPIP